VPVRQTADLKDGDTIRIDTGQVLRCNFSERIIEEERNIISQLECATSRTASGKRSSPSTASTSPSTAARWSASWAPAAAANPRSCA
jgi:hypothetical protein